MKSIVVRNVNEAYKYVISDAISPTADRRWDFISSRLGDNVIEYPTPFATTYKQPRERVLFNSTRDANPFFHVMEALWILSGHRDVEWISKFNDNIQNYSDDNKVFHGGYGWRMRIGSTGYDQLSAAIHRLIDDPTTRRAVVSLYDPELDTFYRGLDMPCNTTIYFKVRDHKLNMTVCCRSNDVIWGAYGANAVHFSILQEYVAACVDVGIGTYTQISDSFHIYLENKTFKKHQKLGYAVDGFHYGKQEFDRDPLPLVLEPATFDSELSHFMEFMWGEYEYTEPFLRDVAVPMRLAWNFYKDDNRLVSLSHCESIQSWDWKFVAKQWIDKRTKKWI